VACQHCPRLDTQVNTPCDRWSRCPSTSPMSVPAPVTTNTHQDPYITCSSLWCTTAPVGVLLSLHTHPEQHGMGSLHPQSSIPLHVTPPPPPPFPHPPPSHPPPPTHWCRPCLMNCTGHLFTCVFSHMIMRLITGGPVCTGSPMCGIADIMRARPRYGRLSTMLQT
jgi:hypothetical protein